MVQIFLENKIYSIGTDKEFDYDLMSYIGFVHQIKNEEKLEKIYLAKFSAIETKEGLSFIKTQHERLKNKWSFI